MNKTATDNHNHRHFLVVCCLGMAMLHFVATFALAGNTFVTGMGSFTQDVSSEVGFWHGVLWLWTPLAMGILNPNNTQQDAQLIGLALLWSCCVGIGAGFVLPAFKRRLDRPLYPPYVSRGEAR